MNSILLRLVSLDPAGSLETLVGAPDFTPDFESKNDLLAEAFARVAMEDSEGAVEWLKRNEVRIPDGNPDRLKRILLGIVTKEDPVRAFALLGELGPDDSAFSAAIHIVQSAVGAEQRTVMLGLLRDHLASVQDDWNRNNQRLQNVGILIQAAAEEGFESGSR